VSGYEFNPPPEKAPKTQSASSGGPPDPPPRPPKLICKDLLDPGEPGERIFLPEHIELRELARLMDLKTFKLVAELIGLGIFRHADETVDFPTASVIVRKHGFVPEPLF
jgi:hypothetical protein